MQLIHFFFGMVAMQLLYLTYYFFIFRRLEFLNYLIFILSVISFTVLVKTPYLSGLKELIGEASLLPAGFAVLLMGHAMYYQFIRRMLEAPVLYPFFNRVIRIAEKILIVTGLITLLLVFDLGTAGVYLVMLIKTVYLVNIILQVYVVVFLLRTRGLLNLLIMLGSVLMGLLLKWVFIPEGVLNQPEKEGMDSSADLLLWALVSDFLFINFILIYKARQSELRVMQAVLEKQMELHRQRSEIRKDLHDDVGGSLSALQVYAGIAEKLVESDPGKTKMYLSRIALGLHAVMGTMNDVIWALKTDTVHDLSLISRIKDFYVDVFDARNLECRYDVDEQLDKRITNTKARKFLMLIAKEAINNSIKHSQADRISVVLKEKEGMLHLQIADNGKGLPAVLPGKGEGLVNLVSRAAALGGQLKMASGEENRGVAVSCLIPLANISD